MDKNDGGPAFPFPEHYGGYGGITQRDYFAAAALPALVESALDLDHENWEKTAAHAYIIADAMIAARNL